MALTTSECVRILGVETEFPWPHIRSLGRPHALLGDVRIFMAAVGGLVPTDGKLKSTRCIPQNTAALRVVVVPEGTHNTATPSFRTLPNIAYMSGGGHI